MATSNIDKQSFGQAGAAYVTGTSAVTGDFCAITSLDDATYFSAITWPELNKSQVDGSAISNTDTIVASADTIPKGVTIYGQISGFTLAAGRVIAYNQA
jgi:hypothetical protein